MKRGLSMVNRNCMAIGFIVSKVRILLALCCLLIQLTDVNAQTDLDQGIQLYEENKLEDAESFFMTYIKSNKDNSKAYYFLGRTCFDQNDLKAAVKSLEKAVELDGSQADYYVWLGHAYGRKTENAGALKKLGLAKKSKSSYEKAVEMDPTNIDGRDGLMNYLLQAPGIAGGSK